MTILILGHNGMLGHMLQKYLCNEHNICTTVHYFPSKEFKNDVLSFDGDFIINAIGSIPQKSTIFNVNYELPIWLNENIKTKIIHPGTDCEHDDSEYGRSKRYASEYIKKYSNNTKILKCSIIGPELKTHVSLFDWFLSQTSTIYGYTNVTWNGITTLEWSKQCLYMMLNWDLYKKETIIEGTCLSKYELLGLIKKVFDKDINITPDSNIISNKCLVGDIRTINIQNQLEELKQYIKS